MSSVKSEHLDQVDVCIVGAGPAGSVAAITLAKAGIASHVFDKATFPRDKVCGDAISGTVVDVLNDLDPAIVSKLMLEPNQLGSYGVSFVAPNLKSLRVPFRTTSKENGEAPPGFVCPRLDFDDLLVREMKNYPEITFHEGTEVGEPERQDQRWILKDKSGSAVCTCKLLLIANGAQSRFARHHAGVHVSPKHQAAGLRAYYKGVAGMDAENFVELHFLKEFIPGYFWIFPLPGGMANVGVGMRSDAVRKKRVNLKESMLHIIQSTPRLKERFRSAELVGKFQGFGLPMGSKKRALSGDGYMLLGDAAGLIDPFTGEGIGNAVISGQVAAQQTLVALQHRNFTARALKPYDAALYARTWSELKLSRRMQSLLRYPWMFNLVVNKANHNKALRDTISFMYEDVDLRSKLKRPGFYLKLLIN